jgi:hypothetical protein
MAGSIGLRATAYRAFTALSVPVPRAGRELRGSGFQFLHHNADN